MDSTDETTPNTVSTTDTLTETSQGSSPFREDPNPIRNYFTTLWSILTHPARFFRNLSPTGGVTAPLVFALVTHWVGSALEFLWKGAMGGMVQEYFQSLFKIADSVSEVDSPGRSAVLGELRERAYHWLWGAGSVIIDPFLTLASILFTSFFVYIGARLLVTPSRNGAPSEITFETALRVICYGMAPAVLAGIPLVGSLLSGVLTALVTIVAAREIYRITTTRAVVVALFPKILLLGLVLMGIFLVFVVLFKLFASVFTV